MVDHKTDEAFPTGTSEARPRTEAGVPNAGVWRSRAARASEVGLALLYLLAFAALALGGLSGDTLGAAVGAAGLLVALGVCVAAALRGQLFTSVLLMAVLMGLLAIGDFGILVQSGWEGD